MVILVLSACVVPKFGDCTNADGSIYSAILAVELDGSSCHVIDGVETAEVWSDDA